MSFNTYCKLFSRYALQQKTFRIAIREIRNNYCYTFVNNTTLSWYPFCWQFSRLKLLLKDNNREVSLELLNNPFTCWPYGIIHVERVMPPVVTSWQCRVPLEHLSSSSLHCAPHPLPLPELLATTVRYPPLTTSWLLFCSGKHKWRPSSQLLNHLEGLIFPKTIIL